MFPWENLSVSKQIQKNLKEFAEWSTTETHTVLLTEEKLNRIRDFVQQTRRSLHLFMDSRGQILGAFSGQFEEEVLVEWEELYPTDGRRLAGLRWLIFGSHLDIEEMSLDEKFYAAYYGFDLVVKGDLAEDCAVLFDPEAENGYLSRRYISDHGYSLYSLTQLEPGDRLQQITAQLGVTYGRRVEEAGREKALLMGLELPGGKNKYPLQESLKELAQLVETAGGEVASLNWQSRETPHPAFYIGVGKAEELRYRAFLERLDLIVFDDELSPAQQRNLEQLIPAKIVDRSRLILDIFAQHAHSREGKLQVELAQLKYMLPRLTGQGQALSRLGAGIGTRGPGETKLEVDRRRIRKRIQDLEREIKEVAELRELHHHDRKPPVVALVGYTNAGKSTLLNHLTNAGVLAENMLFATLDPTVRKLDLGSSTVLLSDTVGFIQKLPHHLVASFKATLDEVQRAEVLLHVVDASHSELELQMRTVWDVLGDLQVLDKPIITVFNKSDLITEEDVLALTRKVVPSAVVSARTGVGIDHLLDLIREEVERDFREMEILLPYDEGGWVEKLHNMGEVLKEEYRTEGIFVQAKINPALAGQIEKYEVKESD